MKNLTLVLFLMLSMAVTSEIQAQTACTPAQIEACKKMGGDQSAACQKICDGKMASTTKTASATAVKVVNKSPEKSKTCAPACAKGKVASTSATPVKLVGLEILSTDSKSGESKKVECSKPCQKKTEE